MLHNVSHDSVPQVRRRSLRLLVEHHGDSPFTKDALAVARASEDPRERIFVTELAPDEEGLERLGEILRDRDEDAAIRAEATAAVASVYSGNDTACALLASAFSLPPLEVPALEALVAGFPSRPLTLQVLRRAIAYGPTSLVVRGLTAIRDLHEARLRTEVEALAPTDSPDAVLVRVAQVLESMGAPESEDVLLALALRRLDGVTAAALRALGRLGTVRSVEGILSITGRDGRPLYEALDAVRRIQARVSDAEPGRVAVVAIDAGAVALDSGDAPLRAVAILAPDEAATSPRKR